MLRMTMPHSHREKLCEHPLNVFRIFIDLNGKANVFFFTKWDFSKKPSIKILDDKRFKGKQFINSNTRLSKFTIIIEKYLYKNQMYDIK